MKLRLKQGGIVKLQNAAETIPTVIVADPMSKRNESNSKSFMDFNKNGLLNRITLLGQNVRDVSNKLKFDYGYNDPDEVFGNFQSDPPYQNIKNKSDLELGKEEYNRIINNYNNAIVREPKDFSTSDKEFYKNTTHQGAFNSSTGVITLLHPISSPNADRYAKSIFIHEQQHSGLPNVQEAMISKGIEEHPGKLLRSGVTPDKYGDSPTEILSRRQQSMGENNIDPKSHISVDMLDPDGVMEFIDLEKSGKKPHGKNSVIDVPKDSPFYKGNGKGKMELYDNALLKRYTPEFLDFLFNNVAANTSNKSNDKLQYSKNGGTVKLQNASETIPTIVADPMSQKISQNNHLAQIMERDAAKAEGERKVEAAEKKADERINNEDNNLASQFMFSGETGEGSRGANTNARRAKYVAEELGLDGNKAFLDSYKKDGKTGAIAFGTTLLTAPMAGEFATYGLLGGAARLAGGMAGSTVGSGGLGKVGDWADNRLGTNGMGTTGRIVGGFAGGSPGSNFAYKGALDLASKAPSIARIGATDRFIGDVAGRALGRSVSGTNLEISDLQRNIEAGKIGGAPTTTKTLGHNSEEPISQLKINFPAGDVVERNAPIGHVGLTGNETVQGFIGARPYHLKGKVKLNKPMVQIGEAVGDGKNITRNQILDFAQKSSADGINFQGIADNTLQNQDVYAVFKDVAVNPKLTIRERLGLSKGKYGSLNRFQKEALDDLDYAIERSNWILQYKDGKFFYGPKGSGENGIRKFSSLPSKTIFGSKDIDGTYVFYDNGNGSISNTDPSGYGGPNNDVSKSGNLIITSPKADAIDNGIEGIFPDTIDKNTMKSFGKANDQFIRPGTYVSGDAGQLPLGMQLKSDGDAMHEIGTIRNNNGDIKRVRSGTVDDILRHLYTKRPYKSGRTGLSVDSYMAILKQGNRPGHALRFSPDGFSIFNGQGIENKGLYDLHQQMLEGKIPQQQFVDAFNKWVEPYNGMKAVIKNGEVIIPHPFIRYKQGGNI